MPDAIGEVNSHIGNIHKYAREEDRQVKPIFELTIDGVKYASHQFTYARMKHGGTPKGKIHPGISLPGCQYQRHQNRRTLRDLRGSSRKLPQPPRSHRTQLRCPVGCIQRNALLCRPIGGGLKKRIEEDYKKCGKKRN